MFFLQMFLETNFMRKDSIAFVAIEFLVMLSLLMVEQNCLGGKEFIANFTHEWSISGVESHMRDQMVFQL